MKHASVSSLFPTGCCFFFFMALCLSVNEVGAQAFEKSVERTSKSTVRVVSLKDGELKGHGSGFIVSKQGHIATNHHVIEGSNRVIVLFAEGDRLFGREAEIVAMSEWPDLAILRTDPIPVAHVVKIASCALRVGQKVVSVGFPGAVDHGTWVTMKGVDFSEKLGEGRILSAEAKNDFVPVLFSGAVAKNVTRSEVSCVLHSAKVSGGNSGGPLVDEEGRVCGINTALIDAKGVDYPVSIHASELVSLARSKNLPLDVLSTRASVAAGGPSVQTWLMVSGIGLSAVTFLMVLRRPRAVLIEGFSRLTHRRAALPGQTPPQISNPAAAPMSGRRMSLRGRDLEGNSFHLEFDAQGFKQNGGRLYIGRKPDLCQLVVSHDSISRQHAVLLNKEGVLYVEDRNSGNGTALNGCEIPVGCSSMPLQPGDRLKLGEVELVLDFLS